MSRNYEGGKLCRQWLLDGFEDSYLENRSEYSAEEQKKYDDNIMLYWKYIFNEEHNYKNLKIKIPNLQARIEDYYKEAPSLVPVMYREEIEDLRIKWGYVNTTPEKWSENFYNVLAFRTIQLLNKYKVDYSDLY